MPKISIFRLYLLRAMYLLVAVGLILTYFPEIIFPTKRVLNSDSVVQAFLGAMAILALLGVRYPIQMLPILLFELTWKSIWIIFFALPVWMNGALDESASTTFFACAMGVVLTPLVLPWKYIINCYVKAPGDPWVSSKKSNDNS